MCFQLHLETFWTVSWRVLFQILIDDNLLSILSLIGRFHQADAEFASEMASKKWTLLSEDNFCQKNKHFFVLTSFDRLFVEFFVEFLDL
jgi:hypothetical protein